MSSAYKVVIFDEQKHFREALLTGPALTEPFS